MSRKFSLARYTAAVSNGAKSPGPSTPEARQKIAGNAVTHGLTARSTLLPGENAALFRQFFEGFEKVFQPANPVEYAFLEEIVDAKWRTRRAWGTEGTVFQMTMLRNREKIDHEFENAGPDVHYAAAFEHLANNTHTLNQLHRQETRLSRAHDRTLNQLLTLQEIRQANPPICPTPETSSNPLTEQHQTQPNEDLQNNPKAGENPHPCESVSIRGQ
jgi:hypothetical protein